MCGSTYGESFALPKIVFFFLFYFIYVKKHKVEHVTRVIVLIFKQNKAILNFSIFYKIK